jgi:chromosome segregation ATPase
MISAEAKNQNIEKEIGEWRVIIHAKKEGKESSTNDYSGQIEVIHNHREDYCRAGDVKIGKCEKVIDRENRLKESMNSNLTDISSALEKKRLAEEEKQRKETVQAAEKRIQELQAETAKNNEQKGTLRGKKVRGEQKLFLLKQRISQFESQLRIYRKSSDLIAGKIENTELKESQAELTEKRKHYESLQRDLKQLNELQKKKSRTIQKIFDTLVKKTLSDEYSGQIDFRNNEIQFQIQEAAGMTGEAVETLSHVLADLTALQCSMNGIGFHPRFLLHDSPREADLDRHIYERYLGMVMKLATDNGKRSSEDAPFQYIVTTTSKPPDDLKSVVRVKLQGHPHSELLFRQVLKAPSAEQLELSLTHE